MDSHAYYDNPLIARYASDEMSRLWGPQRKFSTWRRIWLALAEAEPDPAAFERAWSAYAASLDFDELNDLIERHNRWYPIESRLPMDPTTGDFVLVNGRDYRLAPLDERWVLERFPPRRELAVS